MWDVAHSSLAKRHFGNPLRLQVAEWVLRHGVEIAFKQQEALDGVRNVTRSVSSVPKQLGQLVDDGMLQRSDTDSGHVYYTYLEHPLWDAYAAILQTLHSIESPADHRAAPSPETARSPSGPADAT